MSRLKSIIILILVTIILLVTISISIKPNSKLMNSLGYVGYVIKPVQSVLNAIGKDAKYAVGFIPRARTLENKNKKLEKKVNKLEAKLRKYAEYKHDNERFRKLLELKNQYNDVKLVAAEIIARDPGNWFSTFDINKGRKDGIRKNSVVISNEGLVGYVMDTGVNWSKVITILDTDCSVGALVERTRDNGILVGDESMQSDGYVRMNYINNSSRISVGDSIETSGLSKIFPKGINIGKVVAIKRDSDQLTKYALIKPSVDFGKAEEVMVMRKKQ